MAGSHRVGRFGMTLDVGENRLSPVCDRYRDRLAFRFTGRISHVHFAFGRAAHVTVGEQIEEQLRFD